MFNRIEATKILIINGETIFAAEVICYRAEESSVYLAG